MGFFKKKADPITERARSLSAEIAALESKIEKLSAQQVDAPHPRVRSTAFPHTQTTASHTQAAPAAAIAQEPIFEKVDSRIDSPAEAMVPKEHFNELGVRKYDLAATIRRFKNRLQGRPAANPKLVNYLAAGSIQGLRPLRYEKRVARQRFVVVAIIFVLLIWGFIVAVIRHN